jgi:hypothetical protein
MADLISVLGIIGFFGVAGLLVKVCDHIIGPEEAVVSAVDHHETENQEVAA